MGTLSAWAHHKGVEGAVRWRYLSTAPLRKVFITRLYLQFYTLIAHSPRRDVNLHAEVVVDVVIWVVSTSTRSWVNWGWATYLANGGEFNLIPVVADYAIATKVELLALSRNIRTIEPLVYTHYVIL